MPSGSPAIRRCAPSSAARALTGQAASTSQMGRFETEWLAQAANLAALDGPVRALDRPGARAPPPDGIILDMDSSVSPTYGQQEGSA